MISNSDMIPPESRLQQSLFKLNSIILRSQTILANLEKEYTSLGGLSSDLGDSSKIQELEFEIGGLEAFGRRLIGKFTPEQRKQQIVNNYAELEQVVTQSLDFTRALNDVSVSNNTKIENKLISQSQELEDSLLQSIKKSRSKSDKANEVVDISPSIPSTLDVINNVSYEPEVTVEQQYLEELQELEEESDIDAITRLNNQIKEAELKMIESSIESELTTFEELITYARPGVGNLYPQLKEVVYVGLMNRFQLGLDFHDNLIALEKNDFQETPSPLTIELKNGHLNLYSQTGKTYKVLHLRKKIQNQINEERSPRLTTQSKLTLPAKRPSSDVEANSVVEEKTIFAENIETSSISTIDIPTKTPKPGPDFTKISSTIAQKPTLKKNIDDYTTTINNCLEQGFTPTYMDNGYIELRNHAGKLTHNIEVKDPIKQSYFLEHNEELEELQNLREAIVVSMSETLMDYKTSNPDVNFQIVVAPIAPKSINLGFYPIEANGNRGKFVVVKIGGKQVIKAGLLINRFSSFSTLILNDPRVRELLK
jgi:hypothetical protein